MLEKTLESPLDCKEIQPVHPKGNQSWVFIGGTDVEAETPVLWPPDKKSWLIGKDPGSGKELGQEEKGTTEDEMVGWHHWLEGQGVGWTPGVGDGQGGLVCFGSWGHKESDMTEWLNWTELPQLQPLNSIFLEEVKATSGSHMVCDYSFGMCFFSILIINKDEKQFAFTWTVRIVHLQFAQELC